MHPSPSPSFNAELETAWQERQQLIAETVRRENNLLRESLSNCEGLIDPQEPLHEQGELWDPVSGGESGSGDTFTPAQLTQARQECRLLALTNEFAINGHENRISYIVGTGHKYQVTARRGMSVSRDALATVQQVLDDFLEVNRWHQRQQEIVRRRDRDGEALLRLFVDGQGMTHVRFVEPWQVGAPSDPASQPSSGHRDWGIETDPDDVEQVLGFWLVDGSERETEYVPAAEIQHRKANVDANSARGIPLFYPVRRNLLRAEKLLRNMAAVSDIQTAIALIRRHQAGGRSALEQLRGNLATATRAAGGGTAYFQKFEPGTILDIYGGTEYDFPAQGLDATRYVHVLQAILRAVASRLVMPEFMLTSDASNANYSSTLVAEGPAVKMFERLQHDMIVDDVALLRRVLQTAAAAGRLESSLLDEIQIQAQPPQVAVRDRLDEARTDEILVRRGAMSKRTMALRHGLDPDQELEQQQS